MCFTLCLSTLYQLVEEKSLAAMNSGNFSECKPLPPSELGETIRIMIKKLYANFLNDEGTKVDYDAMAQSQDFDDYETLTRQLQRVDISQLSTNGRLGIC